MRQLMTAAQLNKLLSAAEGRNLECKEAKNGINFDKNIVDYCAALSNEGGGFLILGATNHLPHEIVGTNAFQGKESSVEMELFNKLKIRVDMSVIDHPQGRVIVLDIESRRPGLLVMSTGNYRYPCRRGESLAEMSFSEITAVIQETEPDFTSQIVEGLTIGDLDSEALEKFKELREKKLGTSTKVNISQLLRDCGLLMRDGGLNYAALILLGRKDKITERLPQSEIIFEWRSRMTSVVHDYRFAWRGPFILGYDEIWRVVDARNIRFPFQEGFIQREVHSFDEKVVREALLNAVTHRRYQSMSGSVLIKANPTELTILSPGGFPPGITAENVLYETAWRNRCLAEALERIGLVERSGQGMDEIYKGCIRDGKGAPDIFADDYRVNLRVPAQVEDAGFILFLEKILSEKQVTFSFEELIVLERIRKLQITKKPDFVEKFIDLGIIEKVGRGRGRLFILSSRYYKDAGKLGVHTRLKGLSRDAKKSLILDHLKEHGQITSLDVADAFPELKSKDITNLLQELRRDGQIYFEGKSRRFGCWKLTRSI